MAEPEFTPEELATEEWRSIPGYEGYYEASNLGRIRSARSFGRTHIGRMLKPATSKAGYRFVLVCRGSKASARAITVHRLVSTAFLGPKPVELVTNHIDSNRSNNRITNLEYVTQKENIQQAARLGRMGGRRGPNPRRQGENNHRAKLTAKDVIAIRAEILSGVSGVELADQYGVTSMAISQIKNGHKWSYLEELRDKVIALGSHKGPRR